MRRRPPPPIDTERVRAMLAAGGPSSAPTRGGGDPEATGSSAAPALTAGWVPPEEPPAADLGWLAEMAEAEGAQVPDGSPPPPAAPPPPLPAPGGRHRAAPAVLTVPAPFRSAELAVPWRAVVGLGVVLALASVVLAVRVARAESATPEAVPIATPTRTSVPTAFSTPSGAGAAPPTPSTGGAGVRDASTSAPMPRSVVVDVVGQVAHPGVVAVLEGARVTDVLTAAGGALPGADLARLNLARVVVDGEHLFVPRPGEAPPALVPAPDGGGGTPGPAGGRAVAPVDLNAADLAALDGLPGVGPVLAQRILDWRAEHHRFSSVDELGEVPGIGDKLLVQLRPRVRVS